MFAQEDYIIKILKLQDCHLRIIKVESEKINQISFTVVHATNTLPTEKCPVCKSNNIARKDCRIRVINHATVVGFNCLIKYHLLRYYCKDCSKIFNENNNFISPRIQHSNIVIQNILKDCKEICSFRSIAKRYHLSTTTVIKIFTENVKFGRLPLTEVIGVDEFKGTVGFSKYCFIIKDLLNSEIIEILSSRKQEIIEGFLKSIPKNERETVKFIVMDLWKPYRTIFRFWFSNAKLIADRFHYVRLITDRFNRMRIKLMDQIKSKLDIENNYELRQKLDIDYYFLKKYWKIILEYDGEQKNTEFYCPKLKRRIRKFDVLDHVLNLDNQLGEAYYLKNKFLTVINASTLENIEKNLLEWIKEVNSSMVRDYDVAIETILYWKQEIINSFIINPKTGNTMTNASTEGTNNFCKVVKRVSYGYRDFNLMRARILYCNRKNIVFKSQSIKDN